MADTVELRAQIDTQTVRGLQLINGGTAAALTAIVPAVLQRPSLRDLAAAMILGIVFASIGLVASIVHNRLRRKCSVQYDRGPDRNPPCRLKLLRRFESEPNEPCICTVSVIFMWASVVAFILGAGSVAAGGWSVIEDDPLGEGSWCTVRAHWKPETCSYYSELHCLRSSLADGEDFFCVPRPD